VADRYQKFARSGPGRAIVHRLGLPNPARLRRHEPGAPVTTGPVLLGGAGRLLEPVGKLLAVLDADVRTEAQPQLRPAALVFDASGIRDTAALRGAYEFFHPVLRSVAGSGRVIIFGTDPADAEPADHRQATAQHALQGLVRSIGKEIGRGATANLVYVAPGAEAGIESTLRFLLSGRSAYVSGQVIRIGAGKFEPPADWERPLSGKVALVTGAARGIGEAIAEVLARDGAHVVCLDIPAQGDALAAVANRISGSALQVDITAADAPARITAWLLERHGGLDVVVHNAGVTKDRRLANLRAEQWDQVLDINLAAQQRIDDTLLQAQALHPGGRIVGVSSISGIAGNFGQSNYATSKAGVIGRVHAMAPALAGQGITINAVAPGFIETRMTAAIPLVTREAGRRMNSLAQGGLPVDVAETIGWLAGPGSGGITGNVVRVCGQSMLGA
jgi:3-oxoacyl-[acyl-carrier protein] reductase